jgi:hypothetical protein
MIRLRSYGWAGALAVVGLLACVGDGTEPVAPAGSGSSDQVQAATPVTLAARAVPGVSALGPLVHPSAPQLFWCRGGNASETGTKVIGPAGGTVTFGPHSLIIPPGALESSTRITAATHHGDTLAVTFGPSGLVFAKPATLALSYKHCTMQPGDSLSIVLVTDQMTEVVQMVPSHDRRSNQAVEGLIQHFSVYAASESRTGIPPTQVP